MRSEDCPDEADRRRRTGSIKFHSSPDGLRPLARQSFSDDGWLRRFKGREIDINSTMRRRTAQYIFLYVLLCLSYSFD